MKTRTAPSDRIFGLYVAAVLIVLGAWPRVHGRPFRPAFVVIGCALLAVAAIVPSLLGPVKRLWLQAADAIARILNDGILAVLFFLLFTPVGWIRRLFGVDALNLRPRGNVDTYWKERGDRGADSMRFQF